MKILFDQGNPAPLRKTLAPHSVSTAFQRGWTEVENGDLLAAAEKEFDAFVTTDNNLRHQQNISRRQLAILALPTTSWPEIQKHLGLVSNAELPWVDSPKLIINSARVESIAQIAFVK